MTDKTANKMWGGRFAAPAADIMEEINASIGFDKVLSGQDIRGSKAHAEMLAAKGIISKADAAAIIDGLGRVEAEIASGAMQWSRSLEDVHMNVESRLRELIGTPAGRLHTARSRNDQVALDFRLYVRDRVDGLDAALQRLMRALVTKAKAHAATVMPGFTHLQPAQPVTFGHHLLAYVEMIARDRLRLRGVRVHMNVESRLRELIGTPAGRLHTARSRNDQVALDFRLYVRDRVDGLDAALQRLMRALVTKAKAHAATVMPGFTHLQPAQPVTFGHHLLAYVEMIARDRARLRDARVRMNESPLGAAALAGTSFPIDRHMTAKALGFDRPSANSLDAVSDRDFALEVLAAASISAMHLSRLAEEIVIWMTPMFGFIRMSDRFTTGSSIMPQKRNPDAAELVKGKIGRIAGAFQSLLMVMKGLPLTYGKDMQEDKEVTFDALNALGLAVDAMTGMVEDLEPNVETLRKVAGRGYATATDLADWLVRTLEMPFRDAHHVTGRIVAAAEKAGVELDVLPLAAMQAVEPRITAAIFDVLSPENSVKSRVSYGGTAPQNVAEMAERWIKQLETEGGAV